MYIRKGVPQGSALGPTTFNLSINDLFYHIKTMKLNIYGDDGQLYASDTNPRRLEERMVREVEIANSWFQRNGMIADPGKYQGMIQGKTDHQFSFSTTDSIELWTTNSNSKSTFHHFAKKINNPCSGLTRFDKLISARILLRLYKHS